MVLGLSKVARLAKMFARRMQNQQRFTQQLLEAFNAEVQPLGCAAIVEAIHLGRQHASKTSVTAASFGCFYAQPETFMQVPEVVLSGSSLYVNAQEDRDATPHITAQAPERLMQHDLQAIGHTSYSAVGQISYTLTFLQCRSS